MDDILDVLVAYKVPGAVIVRVAKLIANAQQNQDRRARNTERMRVVRTHAHTGVHTETQSASLIKEDLSKKILKKEPRPKKLKTTLPDDWQPKGPQRDPNEADEFRNKARANGWTYADWHAAYDNYQKHPDYNWRNKNGGPVLPIDIEQRRELAHKMHMEGATGDEIQKAVWGSPGVGAAGTSNAPQLRFTNGMARGENPKMG